MKFYAKWLFLSAVFFLLITWCTKVEGAAYDATDSYGFPLRFYEFVGGKSTGLNVATNPTWNFIYLLIDVGFAEISSLPFAYFWSRKSKKQQD